MKIKFNIFCRFNKVNKYLKKITHVHAELLFSSKSKNTQGEGKRGNKEEAKRNPANKCCLVSRLVSFRFIPFRFVNRLVEALEEPPSRASITAAGWKETGSGDGRNKKVKILES